MGVYISNIEMPEEGWHKAIMISSDGTVVSYYDCIVESGKAVSVPQHGRLIDADYLKLTFCSECTLYPDKCLEKTADGCDWHSIAHLEMCPTIIEAEGE